MAGRTFEEGDWVVYVPGVAQGDCLHEACERGVVTRLGAGGLSVFVRYGTEQIAKSTRPEDLVHAVEYFQKVDSIRNRELADFSLPSNRQPPLEGFRTYLGDGLYANFDGFNVVLSAENGIFAHDTVYLEPAVLDHFKRWHATKIVPLFQKNTG